MSAKTLRQVCETLEVTRRAVQGYEKEGLVTASGRNERGWLLYDEECQEKIRKIRFLQSTGLRVREIAEFLEASEGEQIRKLEERRKVLENEIREREALVRQITKYISEKRGGAQYE